MPSIVNGESAGIQHEAALRAQKDAMPEFGRKIDKLQKRGVLDKQFNSRVPKLVQRKSEPDPVRNAFFSKEAVTGVFSGMTASNATRAGMGTVKMLDELLPQFEVGIAQDAVSGAGSLAGGVTAAVAAGMAIAKLDEAVKSGEASTVAAAGNADQGYLYLLTNGEKGDVNQFLAFGKATEPIIVASGQRSNNTLDKQQHGANVFRYLSTLGGSVASFTSNLSKLAPVVTISTMAASAAAGVLGVFGGALEVVSSNAQDRRTTKEINANAARRLKLQDWAEGTKDKLDCALNHAQVMENDRRHKSVKRSRHAAWVGYGKGAAAMAVGIAAITVAVLSIATAGVALAVVGGAVAAGCLTLGVINSRRESKVARRTKRRQRQAQALVATTSIDELKKMMANDDEKARKRKVVTVERKHAYTRKRVSRTRTVDIRDNGYLAVQIRAHDLANQLGKLGWNTGIRNAIAAVCEDPPDPEAAKLLGDETVKLVRMLKAGGMGTFKLMAVCHQACLAKDPATRSALLRPHMAAALGLPWTPEKPLSPRVYLEPLRVLIQQQRKALLAKNLSPEELDYRKLALDFRNEVGEEVFNRFEGVMRGHPPNKKEVEIYRIARTLTLYETPSRFEHGTLAKPIATQEASVMSKSDSSMTVTSLVDLESQSEEESLQMLEGSLSTAPSQANLTADNPKSPVMARTRVPRSPR